MEEGTGFSLGQPNRGYSGGGGGERAPSRLKSELRFSGGSNSHQEHKSLPRILEAEAAAAAINGVASSSMSFGNHNHNNNWDNSSSHISFTIDQPGKRSKNSDFFTLETQVIYVFILYELLFRFNFYITKLINPGFF